MCCVPLRRLTWRRFEPSSSPSASFAAAVDSLRKDVGDYPLSVSFAQVDADDRYLIDPRIFRRKLIPMIAKRFEQTVEIY
jgi:hypothetical protein